MQSCGFLSQGRIQKNQLEETGSYPSITDTIHLLIKKPCENLSKIEFL